MKRAGAALANAGEVRKMQCPCHFPLAVKSLVRPQTLKTRVEKPAKVTSRDAEKTGQSGRAMMTRDNQAGSANGADYGTKLAEFLTQSKVMRRDGIYSMNKGDLQTDQRCVAREERARILVAVHDLEQALATASFERERAWGQRIKESLAALQTALRETRESADSQGSLLGEIVREFPRLQGRADRLGKEYDALQQQVEMISSVLCAQSPAAPHDVEQTRERLARLLAKLRRVQATETELLFEAYQVDIGVGD